MSIKKYSKKMIQNICTTLINFQDKFIIYGLYQGIEGEDYSDLLEIKLSDVAEDYSCINLNDKEFICDDFMKEIIRGTIKENLYIMNYSDEPNDEDHYYFNNESKYLIKSMPTSTDNGLGPMSKNELEIKLNKIKKIFDDLK